MVETLDLVVCSVEVLSTRRGHLHLLRKEGGAGMQFSGVSYV